VELALLLAIHGSVRGQGEYEVVGTSHNWGRSEETYTMLCPTCNERYTYDEAKRLKAGWDHEYSSACSPNKMRLPWIVWPSGLRMGG